MTLEDFFTLTEMKDGLTAPSRVQELVSVMQKEKDSVVKNVGDATRQWAAVASTIAATENKDCLDLFIQLDGLWFINRWLKDAQNFRLDTNDGFIEESISALLRAVEKLHLDSEKSTSSGIRVTVGNLLGHHSSRIQDRARRLFDTWKVGGNSDVDLHDMKPIKVHDGSDKIDREEGQRLSVNEAGNDKDHASGPVVGEKSPSRSSDTILSENVVNAQIQTSIHYPVSLEHEDVKLRTLDHPTIVSTSVHEVASTKEGLPSCAVDETTSDGPVQKQGDVEGQSDILKLNDLSEKEKQEQSGNVSPEKVAVAENSLASTKPELGPVLIDATEIEALESVKEPALQHNIENNGVAVCHKVSASGSAKTPDRKSGPDDFRAIHSSSPQRLKTEEKDDDCCSRVLHDSSISGSNSGKPEVIETSFSKTENFRAVKEGKGCVSSDGEDISNCSDSIKPGRVPRGPNTIDTKSTDIELEYGIVDALEVARQVAQQVRREVCSSSSEKISEGGNQKPGSPDSIKSEDALTCIPAEEVTSRQSCSAEASPVEEGRATSDIAEAKPECTPTMESSQVTEAAEDPGGNSDKIQCGFDLNEEVGSDDMDVPVNAMSMPLPVVSASKPAATPELPAAPLQFEGTLGWKGSAATSAFRPASPRKNSDSEKNLPVGGNSDISKQRQDWLNIDLNVAEDVDGLGKQVAESSSLPSGQSSLELSPKRSSRLELDLNSIGDGGDAQSADQRMEGLLSNIRNGHWSSSPASASSSVQPSVRNIDLNDRPYLHTDLVDQGPSMSSHSIDAYGGSRSDGPVISILGTRVDVGRREFVSHSVSLPNGRAMDPVVDLTMSRSGGALGIGPTVSYNHSHVFGYNGLTSASGLSFSPAMYGSGGTIPYMVDSRGAPVVPQVGSSPSLLSSYSQPSFIMGMTDPQLGLNGVGTSRPNFDLNSGFMIEGGNRDALTARQFFFPGQGRAIEEHVRTIPQPSSSGVGVKRKEPDSGWETYPMSHKHPQPPWK